MQRKYIDDLIEWKDRPNRKPLIVWGARQVGKTYLVRELFAERFFRDSYIYIDCRDDYRFSDFCSSHPNADEVLRYISIEKQRRIGPDTLLIFDEVQECIPLISMMKYFCQDHRDIPVIATGSMVRIRIKRVNDSGEFLFPIGRIDQLTVYPMTFDEYLMNRNPAMFDMVKDAYRRKQHLDGHYHEMAMKVFHEYVLIGGMPESADVYIRTGDFGESRRILRDLYDNYLSDMELYQASRDSVIRSKSIFSKIYSQLNSGSKNFKSTSVQENLRNRDLMLPMDWLIESRIVQRSQQMTDHVTVPLIKKDGGLYRLFLCDMGMFTYQSGIDATTFVDERRCNMLSGIFFENYVAIELSSRGIDLFYWNGKGSSEFEFIVGQGENVIPIDVKKGRRGSLNSLDRFSEHNRLDYAVKVSSDNYGYDEGRRILTVPFYEFPFLADDLAEGKRPF